MSHAGVQIGDRIAGATAASDALRDWRQVRASADIQFAPLAPAPPRAPPDWLRRLSEWLAELFRPIGENLGISWPAVEKALIVLAVLAGLWLAWRLLGPLIAAWRGRPRAGPEADWAPDRAQAAALLEDADRLAAAGRFAEAAHLLLQRSVHHIGEARPEWLRPASTAREISALPMLPERARLAFGAIARAVERSLFALRDLDASDWAAARAAYADFALADLGGSGAEPAAERA